MVNNSVGYLILNLPPDIVPQVARSAQTALGHRGDKLRHAFIPRERDALVAQRLDKLGEHEIRYLLKILRGQVVEDDYLVNSADKLRAQELSECLERLFFIGVVLILCKAHDTLAAFAAGVGGHDDYRVFKAHCSALRIGYSALVKYLEQDVHNIGMRFLYLVEEYN